MSPPQHTLAAGVSAVQAAASTAVTATAAAVAAVADVQTRPGGPGSALGRSRRMLTTPQTDAEGNGRKGRRGIFYHETKVLHNAQQDSGALHPGRRGDFRQRLDTLLQSDEYAQAVARQLYRDFKGDRARLQVVLDLLKDRWSFPQRLFPMLWTHLRRASGSDNPLAPVREEDWVQAFVQWLKVIQSRCGRVKVTRQCLIQKHRDADVGKTYRMGEKLGAGSFGEVYLADHTSLDARRVIKSMKKTQLSLVEDQIATEVDTLKSLDHPHIIRIFEAFETEDQLHIVMDYAQGKDLSDAIVKVQELNRALPEAWSRKAAEQISSALEYMHTRGVIHCDLKPGNVMLLYPFVLAEVEADTASPHVLVADFGLAELFEDRHGGANQVKGSPSYLAPEGFEGHPTLKSDVWALGVMIYEMLLGERPFGGTSNLCTLFLQILSTDPPFEGSRTGLKMPPFALEVVVALLAKDQKVRPTARELRGFQWFAESRAARVAASAAGMRQQVVKAKIQSLGHASYFHRAAMFCVAAGMGMEQVHDLFEVFRDMDIDMSGYLTVEELKKGLQRLSIRQDAGALMTILDLDQDGMVSYTEFLAGALRLEEKNAERLLRYAFHVFDVDGDGFIDEQELRLMLSGDGMSFDLPDGQTVEQVMEEISKGEGRINFTDFQEYLAKRADDAVAQMLASAAMAGNGSSNATGNVGDECGEGATTACPQDRAAALVADLLGSHAAQAPDHAANNQKTMTSSDLGIGRGTTIASESEASVTFPTFHEWMRELYNDTQAGSSMTLFLLRFQGRDEEWNYVAYYLPGTCQPLCALTLALVIYSFWALLTENWGWDPSLRHWDSPPRYGNNIAWLSMLISGAVVFLCCGAVLRRQFIGVAEAVRFERALCAWAIILPWVSCFFANRFRVASLFGRDATLIFASMNSDYDLIVVMLGSLMFLSTRTNMRFLLTLPIGISCVFAYAVSSGFLGTPYRDCGEDMNWFWPILLLMIVIALALTGHRAVERQRRLTFLSLKASYDVLHDLNNPEEDDPVKKSVTATDETRTARLKRALDLTRRLSTSSDVMIAPLKAQLRSLVEVLEATREDVAQKDRLLTADARETLETHGIGGPAADLLLALLDAPPQPDTTGPAAEAMPTWPTMGNLACLKAAEGVTVAAITNAPASQLEAPQPWGWSTLGTERPLAGAAGQLLRTAAAAAAGGPKVQSPGEAALAAKAAGRLINALRQLYSGGPPAAEARAALAVQAAYWLAHSLGLWATTRPWDRLALLIAAAGLHCGSGGPGGRGGALLAADPLLDPAQSVIGTLEALELSGLASGISLGAAREAAALPKAVRRLMSRVRPRCALEDARRVRVQLDEDDQAAWAERSTISGLVLAAADLAFLALPPVLHQPWAERCQFEAAELLAGRVGTPALLLGWGGARSSSAAGTELDAAAWLRGLAEALALPVYETLGRLDGGGALLAIPVGHLRQNAKHWKVEGVGAPARPPRPPGGTLRGTAATTAGLAAEEDVAKPQRRPMLGEASARTLPPEDAAALLSTLQAPGSLGSTAAGTMSPAQAKAALGTFGRGGADSGAEVPSGNRTGTEEDTFGGTLREPGLEVNLPGQVPVYNEVSSFPPEDISALLWEARGVMRDVPSVGITEEEAGSTMRLPSEPGSMLPGASDPGSTLLLPSDQGSTLRLSADPQRPGLQGTWPAQPRSTPWHDLPGKVLLDGEDGGLPEDAAEWV